MDIIDEEVLATLQDDMCRPTVIEEAIRVALAEFTSAGQDDARERLDAELAAVREECDRLAEAIGRGGPLDALVARLTARQAHRETLERDISLRVAARPRVNVAGLETRLRAKLADWRGLLRRNLQEARGVLRTLLIGPLRFTPLVDGRRRGYRFEGTIALDRLLAGVVDLPLITRAQVASPTGFDTKGNVPFERRFKAA